MDLDKEFQIIKEFVKSGEGVFKKPQKNATFKNGDDKHLLSLKNTLIRSRGSKISITEPETVTDDVLWEYIKLQKNLSNEQVEEFAKYHKIAMSIETKLGNLLESFIYKYIKKHNWIWQHLSGYQILRNNKENKKIGFTSNMELQVLFEFPLVFQ